MTMFAGFNIIMVRSRLRRICNNKKLTVGQKTKKIEQTLRRCKLPALSYALSDDKASTEDTITMLLTPDTCTMCIPGCQAQYEGILRNSLDQIRGHSRLIQSVESLRRIPFSSDNKHHEDMLMQLWERLCPHKPLLSRVTRQWTEIGFQGKNPVTDFRGMGLLGLHNLLFLATQYPDVARELLSHSKHRQYGYSFAIVGINMTSLAYNLLCQGHLKGYLYNDVAGPAKLQHFHNFYCFLLYEFDRLWIAEKPTDLMQFTNVKAKFEKRIMQILRSKDVTLTNTFIRNDTLYPSLNNNSSNRDSLTSKHGSFRLNEHDISKTSYYLWV